MIENFLRRPHSPGDYAADVVRIAGLLSVIAAAVWWTWTDAGILALALPALLLPRFLGTRSWLDILFGIVVLVAAWSNVLDLYTMVVGWDLVVHFVCTGLIAVMGYLLLASRRVVPSGPGGRIPPRSAIVLGLALGLAASAVWEMIEWAGFTFISDEIFVTYQDTIGDMVAGGLGGLVGGTLLALVPVTRIAQEVPQKGGTHR